MSIDYKGPQCGCGKLGCIEAFASGPAIARRARAKLQAGERSSIVELAGGTVDSVTSEVVGEAAAAGDRVATEIVLETVELLAFWFGNIIDLLEPDAIIVGGGVASLLKPRSLSQGPHLEHSPSGPRYI
jgi:glucokinase